MQVIELNLFPIGCRKNSLILLLEFVEALLCALLLLSIRRTATEHFVKESHDNFPFPELKVRWGKCEGEFFEGGFRHR